MAARLSSSVKKTRPYVRAVALTGSLKDDRDRLRAFFQRVPNFGEQLFFFRRRGRRGAAAWLYSPCSWKR